MYSINVWSAISMQFFFVGGECVLVHGGRSDASLALCDCWLGRFSHDTTSVHWTQVRIYYLNIVHTTVDVVYWTLVQCTST